MKMLIKENNLFLQLAARSVQNCSIIMNISDPFIPIEPFLPK